MIKIIHFSVDVEIDGDLYSDMGVIMLPDGYSDSGDPVRLVISCHGAGGTVSTDDSQTEGTVLSRYLVANGFAVADVNGLPREYAEEHGIDIRNNIGSPAAVDCYVNAYNLLMDSFNLKRRVFVMGASMGGISSTNLVLSGKVPVIAQAGFCPVLDTYNEIYMHPWSGGLPKDALGIFYGLKKDEDGVYIYEEEKINCYNPAERVKNIRYPVPVRFWHCVDDKTVSPAVTKEFTETVCKNGGRAELVLLPDGGHEPQNYGEPIDAPAGLTDYNGEKLYVKPAVEGAFLWFCGFEKSSGGDRLF